MSASTAKRLLLSLGVLCIGLLAALGIALRQRTRALLPTQTALADPQIKQQVVDELVAQSQGVFDSFPDPMVGRVLQPSLQDRAVPGGVLSSNAWGMREREYALPKPLGTVRVVLLGDSYVFGVGVAPDARCGSFLERALQQRAQPPSRSIECLHVAIPSWNILAEAEFVRRQLSRLRPDLVIHVVVPNDLDDLAGVRGFGAMASASPQHASRAGVVVGRDYAATYLGIDAQNSLLQGLDYESRVRYAQAAEAIQQLAAAVEAGGGRYLLVLNWMAMQSVGLERLAAGLRPEQVALLPFALFNDLSLRVSATNGHWNQAGHEAVGSFLYGIVRARGLLAPLQLTDWAEADTLGARWAAQAQSELTAQRSRAGSTPAPQMAHSIVPAALDATSAAQIYGGLFPEGAGPYVSVVLPHDALDRVHVEGHFLDESALAGTTVHLFADEIELEHVPYQTGKPLLLDAAIPQPLRDRAFLNVRLETDDFVYGGADLRTPLSLALTRIALMPQPGPNAATTSNHEGAPPGATLR